MEGVAPSPQRWQRRVLLLDHTRMAGEAGLEPAALPNGNSFSELLAEKLSVAREPNSAPPRATVSMANTSWRSFDSNPRIHGGCSLIRGSTPKSLLD